MIRKWIGVDFWRVPNSFFLAIKHNQTPFLLAKKTQKHQTLYSTQLSFLPAIKHKNNKLSTVPNSLSYPPKKHNTIT
jgi:hypothetical protein